MEPHARYVFVGSIIVALLVGFLAALFWLSRIGNTRDTRHFTTYFAKQSLSGLQIDSPVTVRGIKLGIVQSIEISSTNIEEVKVITQLDPSAPVRESTRAVIVRNLLTGLAGIDLVGSSEKSPPLFAILPGEENPIIPEGADGLQAFAASIPELVKRADMVLASANRIFSDENQEAMTQILANLQTVSKTLATTSPELADTFSNISKAAATIEKNVKTVSGTADRAVDAFAVSANSISLDFKTLTRDVGKAARTLSDTVEKLNDPRAIIRGPNPNAFGPGEKAHK